MSVKDYFAQQIIKNKVIEYLKAKGDFEYLHQKYKRPFRAYINQNDGDFYVSDDFHQIKCIFSDVCKEKFEQKYPKGIKIYNITNMLICVQEYQLILKTQDNDNNLLSDINQRIRQQQLKLGNKLEVFLQIDDLQVISFDRFNMKQSNFVEYDESVRIHVNFVVHYLSKKSFIDDQKYKNMIPLTRQLLTPKQYLSAQLSEILKVSNNNQQQQQQAYTDKRVRYDSNDYGYQEPIQEKLEKESYNNIVEFKNVQSYSDMKKKKLKKRLRKLKEDCNQEGFLSCDSQNDLMMMDDIEDEVTAVEINLPQNTKHTQGFTQKRQEELDKIDEAMEDILIEDEEEEEKLSSNELQEGLSQDSLKNPEQSIKVSEEQSSEQLKAKFIQSQAPKSEVEKEPIVDSLEDILGEEPKEQEKQVQSQLIQGQSQFDLRKEEEIISNSDSVFENEKIQREVEEQQNKDKIEIEVKLTKEQQVEEFQAFGSLPQDANLIGFGLNSKEKQQELRALRNQGQGGQYSDAKKQRPLPQTQDDLLDFLDTRPQEEKDKDNSLFKNLSGIKNSSQKSKLQIDQNSSTKVTPLKKEDTKQTSIMQFMKKREVKTIEKIQSKDVQAKIKIDTKSKFNQYQEWLSQHEVLSQNQQANKNQQDNKGKQQDAKQAKTKSSVKSKNSEQADTKSNSPEISEKKSKVTGKRNTTSKKEEKPQKKEQSNTKKRTKTK